jgi:ribosome-binding protein aMBF1 (putative translation factor)
MHKEQRADAEPLYVRYNSNTHIAIPQTKYDELVQKAKYYDRDKKRLGSVFAAWHSGERKRLGIDRLTFSKILGVSLRTIQSYEQGKTVPNDVAAYIEEAEMMILVYLTDELKKKRGAVFGSKK